ncbi:MAG: hypothetical protein WB764_01655 [Xanthobacteraceae bacterium]
MPVIVAERIGPHAGGIGLLRESIEKFLVVARRGRDHHVGLERLPKPVEQFVLPFASPVPEIKLDAAQQDDKDDQIDRDEPDCVCIFLHWPN